ncbi:MAG: alginate lyase family protein [Gammaproteobacteria bacterium]|nr:alginate lyase family protein [Gammaproteobacteria bacterium]
MSRFLLYLNTIRFLKLKQVCYQIYYRFRKLRLTTTGACEIRGVLRNLSSQSYIYSPTQDAQTFHFLGLTATLQGNWNSNQLPKLWLYNLHYHDFLNSRGEILSEALSKKIVSDWILANPPLVGVGWEPYCISLRAVNWVKWLSRLKPEEINPDWVESLASQVDALNQQLEHHILANHLFANAKALVFAGVFFGGERGDYWLKKGLHLLDQELSEQFLTDGAHYERSPMYHAILLWDLADLICLQRCSHLSDRRGAGWQQVFISGMEWLKWMVHPDQKISFFNDATFGISPTLEDLQKYAAHLYLDIPSTTYNKIIHGELLVDSGYAVVDWESNHRLIADVALVGPDYQPGHAHADTLSCELSLFGQRVFVNSGISQYGEDAERHRQRSTAAHNTLEVDGEDSSEVWAGFRVARRARPIDISMQQEYGNVVLSAGHDGYQRLPGKVTHHRCWLAKPTSLTITDELEGRYSSAFAYWHIHPDIKLSQLSDTSFELALPQGQVALLSITGAQVNVCESTWHPGFGQSVSNTKLALKLHSHTLKTHIEWSSD